MRGFIISGKTYGVGGGAGEPDVAPGFDFKFVTATVKLPSGPAASSDINVTAVYVVKVPNPMAGQAAVSAEELVKERLKSRILVDPGDYGGLGRVDGVRVGWKAADIDINAETNDITLNDWQCAEDPEILLELMTETIIEDAENVY